MGHPLPLSHWPGKPSFCLKPIQSERWGDLGKEGNLSLVKWNSSVSPHELLNSFPPLFIRTLVLNACSDGNSHLKYGSNFMPSNFLRYLESLLISIANGAFGQFELR